MKIKPVLSVYQKKRNLLAKIDPLLNFTFDTVRKFSLSVSILSPHTSFIISS